MAKVRKPKGASAKKAVMPKTEETTDVRETWNRKALVLQMRGSDKWKEWLEQVAKFNRITVASLVDQAVTRFARESGFKGEPPER